MLGLTSAPYTINYFSPDARETRAVTREILPRYADQNRDGKVSDGEKMGFYRKLATEHGTTLYANTGVPGIVDVGYWPYYENGKPVPHDIVIKWLREYRPNGSQP